MLSRRIEKASLNAWPARQQLLYDGWLLRFTAGYTKRANSVNAFFDSHLDVAEKVTVCEKLYRDRGLVPIFRITPFATPSDLDQVLVRRNYHKISPTRVLHLDLEGYQVSPPAAARLSAESLDAWLEAFCRFAGAPLEQHQTHREILEAIPARRFLATLADADRVVACGVGVLEHPYLGLFDLVTDPQQRNRGYGTQIVTGLLRWAQARGALHAYLQVEAGNAPARHLYTTKLGFRELYSYWYRVATV